MELKIAFMYLDVSNLGDLVIYETSRYIVEDILKKNNVEDYEIVPVDIGSFRSRNKKYAKSILRRVMAGGLRRTVRNRLFAHCCPELSKKMMKKIWHTTPPYQYYIENEKPKLEGADIIIFGGGGLIKFHRQNFYYFLDDVTDFAQRRNIPVLLNAQGIEGYDEMNLECQILKKAVNRACVKYASTRDDFAMLRNCYIENPEIVVRGVCDPAFWTAETYQIRKSSVDSKKVGLNVIRTKIFGEYMYKVNRKALGEVYYEVIVKLSDAGYSVELFSNGVDKDTVFIDWLLEQYPNLKSEYQVTVANPVSTREFVELLAGYDRFMAVRLHSAIVGTVLGVPNVSLVWNRKQILFGEQIGLRQNFITKEKFTSEEIFQRLCQAKPYEMDEEYKMSVYQNLEDQMKKWVIGEGKNRI
ncbi:MAG: polysaccharide pyruvyl transferase family protein [Lachnospiraceae bacterium]|nr:polysaccharide pyruvyl transferase family protein [Lachnospiraceae bacterium]